MTVDWNRMTPREIFDALARAPKVAGPWKEGARRDPSGMQIVWAIDGLRWAWAGNAEARARADAKLRELGFILVDEPEAP